jgi:glycosyltransferase involved in cell wall biosynthesis
MAYLEGLAAAGHELHLLTFETRRQSRAERVAIRARFADRGVQWHRLRYHKRPSLLATIIDVLTGIAVGTYLVRRHHLQVLHARVHVPAAIALAIRRLTRAEILFDIRGLMAEEYVDAGTWREGSLPFRLTKWVERHTLAVAEGAVILTERGRHLVFGDPGTTTDSGAPVRVIPSCADVEAIVAAADRRAELRERFGFGDAPVLAYVGKFSTWYMAAEMASFAAALHRHDERWRLLVVTQSPHQLILDELAAVGMPSEAVTVTTCTPDEVGAHLHAADAAMSFILASPSKVASSPTKVGEYLAAGLPIVVSAGVGDVDDLVRRHGVGVVLDAHDPADHAAAVVAMKQLVGDPVVAARCVRAARQELSLAGVGLPRYLDLYHEVGERLATRPATRSRRRWSGTSRS